MAEDIGSFSKIGHLLPSGSIKDPGGKSLQQEAFSHKKKRKQEEKEPLEKDSTEAPPSGENESPSGKIVDITI